MSPVATTDEYLEEVGEGVYYASNVSTADLVVNSTLALPAESIISAYIGADQIVATHIDASTITGNAGFFGVITSAEIYAGGIEANKIQANNIAADAITSYQLSADAIDGMTITGSTIQTSSSSSVSRVVIDSTGLKGYPSGVGASHNTHIRTSDGKIVATGIITAEAGSSIPTTTLSGQVTNAQIAAGITADKLGFSIGGANLLRNASVEFAPASPDYGAGGVGGTVTWATSTTRAVHGTTSYRATSAGATMAYVDLPSSSSPTRMPVLPSKSYTASVYVYRVSGATTNMETVIIWWDSAGSVISQPNKTHTSPTVNTWARLSHTATSPSNAAYATLEVRMNNAAATAIDAYFDAFQFEEGDLATAFQPFMGENQPNSITNAMISDLAASKITGTLTDAQIAALSAAKLTGQITETQITDSAITTPKIAAGAVVTASLAATAVTAEKIAVGTLGLNRLMNPSFEDYDASNIPADWVQCEGTSTFVSSTDDKADGLRSLKIGNGTSHQGGVGSRQIAVKPGEVYSVRARVRHSNGSGTWYLRIQERTTASTTEFIDNSNRTSFTDLVSAQNNTVIQTAVGTWVVQDFSYTVPAGVTYINVGLYNWSSSTGYLYVDEVVFARRSRLITLEDGVITASELYAGSVQAYLIGSAHIRAGSISANKLSIAPDSSVYLVNMTGSDPTWVAGTIPGWTVAAGGSAWIIATDQTRTQPQSFKLSGGGSGSPQLYQDTTLPLGNYTIECWVRTTSLSGGNAQIRVDALGATITGETGSLVSADTYGTARSITGTTEWTLLRRQITVTAAGSLRISFYVNGDATGSTVWWNDLRVINQLHYTEITPGTIRTENIAASAITASKLNVVLGRGNLLDNSGFEQLGQDGVRTNASASTGWSGANATLAFSTSTVKDGLSSVAVSASTAANMQMFSTAVKVDPNTIFTASAYMRAASTSRTVNVGIIFYSDAGGTVSVGSFTSSNYTDVNTGWVRPVLSATSPATAVSARVYIYVTSPANAETHYVDAVQLEEGELATDYNPKTTELLPGTINATMIRSKVITANEISAGTITANEIAVGAITADRINIGGVTDNLVLNGSFEQFNTSNVPLGWKVIEGAASAFTSDSSDKTEGQYSLKIASGAGTGVGARAIPVIPGDTYVVRIKLRHSNGNGTYYVRMGELTSRPTTDYIGSGVAGVDTRSTYTDVGTAANTTIQSGVGTWFTKEYTYTVPAGVRYISPSIYNYPSTGDLYADEFEVRKQLSTIHLEDGVVTAAKISAGSITAGHLSIILGGGSNFFPDASFESKSVGVNALSLFASEWTGWTASGSTTDVIGTGGVLPTLARCLKVKYVSGVDPYLSYSFTSTALAPFLGRRVTLSAYQYRPNTAPTPTSGHRALLLYDGTTTVDVKATVVTATNTWTRVSVTMDVAAGATSLDCRFYAPYSDTTNGFYYYDAVQLEIADAPSAFSLFGPDLLSSTQISPGAIKTTHIATSTITADKLSFNVGSTNLLLDSSFEVSGVPDNGITPQSSDEAASAWNTYPANDANAAVTFGTPASFSFAANHNAPSTTIARFNRTSGATHIGVRTKVAVPLEPSTTYTMSAYIAGNNNAQNYQFVVEELDQTATLVQTSATGATAIPLDMVFRRYTFTFTTHANTRSAWVYVWLNNAANFQSIYVDNVQLEKGSLATAWSQNLSATVIDGGTITSPVIRTSLTNPKLQMDGTNGLFLTDSSGNIVSQMKAGAGGLDVAASTLSTPPAERMIRWLASSTVVSRLSTVTNGANSDFTIRVGLASGDTQNTLRLEARATDADNATTYAALSLFGYSNLASIRLIQASVLGTDNVTKNAAILNASDQSSYFRGGDNTAGARRIYGPYSATSSSWSSGENTVTYNHNLNLGSNHVVVAHIEDGANASGVSWRVSKSANSVSFILRNLTGLAITAVVKFCIIGYD